MAEKRDNMQFRNQHGKVVTLSTGHKCLAHDVKTLSCETFIGLYYNQDVDALCSISTFGNDSDFEIDVVDTNGHQSIYSADELLDAIADFADQCSKARGL